MDWSTLVPTIIGAALATGGGLLGQLFTASNTKKAETRAEHRERDRWVRDHVRQAHLDFLLDFNQRYTVIDEETKGSTPEDWLDPLTQKFQALRLVCSAEVARCADEALAALRKHAFHDGMWEPVEYAFDQYLLAARKELRFESIPVMGDEE